MRLLLAWLACVPSAAALVASGSTYSRLQAVQVTRASDAQTLGLTSLWGESDRAALSFAHPGTPIDRFGPQGLAPGIISGMFDT